MVNVTISNDGIEKASLQDNCVIAFSISDIAEDSSKASIQITAEGDIHPFYFYYMGYQFIEFMKKSAEMKGAPSFGVLFDLFADGLKEGAAKLIFGESEEDYKEV